MLYKWKLGLRTENHSPLLEKIAMVKFLKVMNISVISALY